MINLTGQLTIGDANNIGNSSNYLKLDISLQEIFNGDITNPSKTVGIIVRPTIWKSKASYTNGKPPIQSGNQIVNEIKSVYIINAATIATAPITNFAGLPGKSLYDKFIYWVHQQVIAMIVADNPTFSATIVDIQL